MRIRPRDCSEPDLRISRLYAGLTLGDAARIAGVGRAKYQNFELYGTACDGDEMRAKVKNWLRNRGWLHAWCEMQSALQSEPRFRYQMAAAILGLSVRDVAKRLGRSAWYAHGCLHNYVTPGGFERATLDMIIKEAKAELDWLAGKTSG